MTPSSRGLLDPVIEAYKKDIDRTLLRENLKLSVEGRPRVQPRATSRPRARAAPGAPRPVRGVDA